MAQAHTIKGIAFDAYGTLFDVKSVAVLAEEVFPGDGKDLAELWRERQIDYTRIRTMSGQYADFWTITRDALEFACDRLALDLKPRDRDRLMAQYERLPAFPENLHALQELRRLGAILGILSNGTPWMIANAVAAAGMDGLFDHILSVDSVRKYKTAPEAYQLGPDAFGCPARDILFISSNAWDVCGATWFGYTTFWVNRFEAPIEKLGVHPAGEGHTLRDVVTFVSGLRADAR